MMRPKPSVRPGSEYLRTPIPMLDLAQPTLVFNNMPRPEMSLTFPPRPPLMDTRKRRRAAADVDGEHSCLHKKKRRLRLFLITSRLSPQFSHPATNIVDRGSSKIAVWAKQKNLGRNLLRKAAILNRVRRCAVPAREAASGRGRLLVEQEKEQRQLEMARLTFHYGSIDTYTRPVHAQSQSMPSPAAVQAGSHHYLISGSVDSTPSGAQSASGSPPHTSISPPSHATLHNDSAPEYRSPNSAYAFSSSSRAQSTRRDYEPLLPSPLGLSNYDALDAEDLSIEDPAARDLYSCLDDEEDDDRYSYLWDEDEDERHDSPFSPVVAMKDSSGAVRTRHSQTFQTLGHSAYDNMDVASSLLGDCYDGDVSGDSVWPSPVLESATQPCYGGASPNFAALDAGPLAVRYPGEPVCESHVLPVKREPVGVLKMLPANMSPNILPAD